MIKKYVILSVIIAAILFVSPMAFAVEFGPNSANITNRYYPAKVGGWTYMLGAGSNWAGRFIYANVVGIEEVSGAQIDAQTFNNVKCLKVNMIMAKQDDEDDFLTIWMAQDTEGNVWFLKIYIFPDNLTILLGASFKSMFMPAVPDVGDPAGIILEEDTDTYCQIVDAGITMNTNFGSYDNCIKSQCLYNSSIESVEYYCFDVGEVRTTEDSGPNPQDVIDLKEYGAATVKKAVVIPLMD
jgi:hypothetical protein